MKTIYTVSKNILVVESKLFVHLNYQNFIHLNKNNLFVESK